MILLGQSITCRGSFSGIAASLVLELELGIGVENGWKQGLVPGVPEGALLSKVKINSASLPSLMPMTPDQAARSRFLQEAASALAASVPMVAAHLNAAEKSVCAHADLPGDSQGSTSCNSCGSALLPGWSASASRVTKLGAITSRGDRSAATAKKTLRLRCNLCDRITVTNITKPPKASPQVRNERSSALVAQSQDLQPSGPALNETQQPAKAYPSSRKARGKKSSLQSLLASRDKTAPATPTRGLDLMDFVKG